MTTDEAKTARAAAKTKWDRMTPEEKAAAKKVAATKKQAEMTALNAVAVESGRVLYNAGKSIATTPGGTPLIGDFGRPSGATKNQTRPPATEAPSSTPRTTPLEEPAK